MLRSVLGIVIGCVVTTAALVVLVRAQQNTAHYSDLYIHANRFSKLYNLCVENMNHGQLDLKSCFATNEAWERLNAHPDWPKKPKKK